MVPDIFEELRSLVELWVPNVSILCDEIFAVLAACPAEAFVVPGTSSLDAVWLCTAGWSILMFRGGYQVVMWG